jgi:hypothetical protein
MIIQHNHFSDSTGILKLQHRFLLDAKHNNVLAPHTNLWRCWVQSRAFEW